MEANARYGDALADLSDLTDLSEDGASAARDVAAGLNSAQKKWTGVQTDRVSARAPLVRHGL